MPSDDKLTFLEQLSNALAGQTLTGGARALGEGIGYKYHGGAWSDIPDVMREALERHRVKTANQTKNEQDALAVASGLAAMSNPISAVGHGIDFAAAVPEMLEYKLSDAEPPTGMIAETGLKRRLAKGGAQADFARANQLQRAKQKIEATGHKITSTNPNDAPSIFQPILRENVNFPEGEGKFQKIKDYSTSAFDLNKSTNPLASEIEPYIDYGMGRDNSTVIFGKPHELGVEFSNTVGLNPRYRGKGYGQQIYQNMADFYGGGISHSGSTLPKARKVYEQLGGIDTGISSGGGTRQALPTREMKADPEALAAFQQRIEQYALPRGEIGESPLIRVESTGGEGDAAFLAYKPNTNYGAYGESKNDAIQNLRLQLQNQPAPRPEFQYDFQSAINAQPATEQNRLNNYLRSSMFNNGIPASDMQMILQRFGVGNYALPNEFTIGGRRYRFEQNPDGTRPRYIALD